MNHKQTEFPSNVNNDGTNFNKIDPSVNWSSNHIQRSPRLMHMCYALICLAVTRFFIFTCILLGYFTGNILHLLQFNPTQTWMIWVNQDIKWTNADLKVHTEAAFENVVWKCCYSLNVLTHWGRATHIFVGNLTIICSDIGLAPSRWQAIIWTNDGIFLIRPFGTNISEILIGNQTFSFMKMHLKMSFAKWRPFCLGLNVLMMTKWWQNVSCWLVWSNWSPLDQINNSDAPRGPF